MSDEKPESASVFKSLIHDPRDVQAPEGSINAELLGLPQQRVYSHDMKGRILLFPRTGIIGVPIRMQGSGHWAVVIVNGDAHIKEGGAITYPRGGYDISVSELEMQTAVELDIALPRADFEERATVTLRNRGILVGTSEDWVNGLLFHLWGASISGGMFR